MAVLLKNLVARTPQTNDLVAITELLALCESAEQSMADSTREDVLLRWQEPDFHLATDAWVIVTTRGQIVGFACVWHKDHCEISTFIGVHPTYRNRGIGTLLLRLVEMRARQFARQAQPGTRVALRGQISQTNQGALNLFEHEGYSAGQQFLRISFTLAEDTGEFPVQGAQSSLRADVSLEHGRLLGATPLYDRDGLCTVNVYRTYEKELRPAKTTNVGMVAEINDLLSRR